MAYIDETNNRYGKLLVLGDSGNRSYSGEVMWECRCDCGTIFSVRSTNLRTSTRACRPCANIIHGHKGTPTHNSWKAMRERCNNPIRPNYKYYGGRGIAVCKRWDDYMNFFADMKERPSDRTLDRINVEGNYEPDNCRWATNSEQQKNKRPRKKSPKKQ